MKKISKNMALTESMNCVRFIALSLIVVGLTMCTKPLDFEVQQPEGIVTVDGLITDLPGPYRVKLAYAGAYAGVLQQGGVQQPITEAEVVVTDQSGNSYVFEESERGEYFSDSLGFRGVVGNTYTLNISTAEGRVYQSLPETIVRNVTFIQLSGEEVTKEVLVGSNRAVEKKGVELYVDFAFYPDADAYVRWKTGFITRFGYFDPKQDIIVFNSSAYTKDTLRKIPIYFEHKRGDYNTVVTMQILSKNAFDFWQLGEKQQDNGGTIFETPPVQLVGNIRSVSDPDERVLGLFSAAATSVQRTNFGIQ